METANQPATGRSTWKGSVSVTPLWHFGVKVYTGTTENTVSFNQLHRGCGCRINYTKTCPTHGPVEAAEIARGYQLEKDRYVVIEESDLEAVRIESSKAIGIERIVEAAAIDPAYFETAHYLEPADAPSRDSYAAFREALGARLAIARVCLRGKEDLVAIRAEGLALVMLRLRYREEIKSPRALDLPGPAPADVTALASQLMAGMVKPFEPELYQDRYAGALLAMIEAKARGEAIEAPALVESGKIVDLMAALKASLAAREAAA